MIQTLTLENGLTLLCAPSAHAKSVSFELFIPAGALSEPIAGSSSVLEEWWWHGAGSFDSHALEDALDAFGARRESEVNLEGIVLSLGCLPEDTARALGIMADLSLRPHLSAAHFAPSRAQAMAALESLEDAPDSKLFTLLTRRFFASRHGRSPFGTRSGLARLTPAAARADWQRRFVPRGSVLAVSGPLEPQRFFDLAETAFGPWRGAALPTPRLAWRGGFYAHRRQAAAQTHMALMYPSVAFAAPGYYESRFMLEALSGSQSNRLFHQVRERRGLAYSVYANTSFFSTGKTGGFGTLEVYAATTPERAMETLELLHAEMKGLRQGLNPTEFAHARTGLLTNLALFAEASSARAASLIRDYRLLGRVRELFEVREQLERLTLADVNRWLEGNPYERPGVMTLGREPLALEGFGS